MTREFKTWIQGLEEEITQQSGMKIELTEFKNQVEGGHFYMKVRLIASQNDKRYSWNHMKDRGTELREETQVNGNE